MFACRLDVDGSVVRHVQPAMPPQPYLIGSQLDWWRLDDAASWREPRFGGPWVSPMPADEAAARVEMRVANNGQQYTMGAFDGQDMTRNWLREPVWGRQRARGDDSHRGHHRHDRCEGESGNRALWL
jgi:hypothetical protein